MSTATQFTTPTSPITTITLTTLTTSMSTNSISQPSAGPTTSDVNSSPNTTSANTISTPTTSSNPTSGSQTSPVNNPTPVNDPSITQNGNNGCNNGNCDTTSQNNNNGGVIQPTQNQQPTPAAITIINTITLPNGATTLVSQTTSNPTVTSFTSPQEVSGSSGLSSGAIAGIVIGSILGGLFVLGLLGFFIFRARRNRANNEFDEDEDDEDDLSYPNVTNNTGAITTAVDSPVISKSSPPMGYNPNGRQSVTSPVSVGKRTSANSVNLFQRTLDQYHDANR